MLKIKSLLIFTLIILSVNSVAYANAELPATPFELESLFDVIEYDRFDETGIHAWDALNSSITLMDRERDSIEQTGYTVLEGDNLYRIAIVHNVPLETLMEWNNLGDYTIYPGQELKVSSGGANAFIVKAEPVEQEKYVSNTKATAPPVVVETKKEIEEPPAAEDSKEMVVTATAYTAYCTGCSGTTAYGIDLRANPNQKVIAVDPRVIPLGTKVWVEGYGEAIAGDTGGAIKGNKIDVFIPTKESAMAWGRKTVKIRVLN